MIPTAKWEDEIILGKGKNSKKIETTSSMYYEGFKYKHLVQACQQKMVMHKLMK